MTSLKNNHHPATGGQKLSRAIIFPLLLTITLMVATPLSAYLLAGTKPSVVSTIFQVIVVLALTFLLIIIFRQKKQRQLKIQEVDSLLNLQFKLDAQRAQLFDRIINELKPSVAQLNNHINSTPLDEQSKKLIEAGITEINNTINTFDAVDRLSLDLAGDTKETVSLKTMSEQLELTVAGLKGRLSIDIPSDISVTQPKGLLQKVLVTLAANALEHSNEHTKVKMYHKKIRKYHAVVVEDSGEGITQEKLSVLFKPLSRVEDVGEFTHQGRGMSLFISRLIMRYVGGDIKVESELGKGTKMTVFIPAKLITK
jgi:signal transduction histidine kinase